MAIPLLSGNGNTITQTVFWVGPVSAATHPEMQTDQACQFRRALNETLLKPKHEQSLGVNIWVNIT